MLTLRGGVTVLTFRPGFLFEIANQAVRLRECRSFFSTLFDTLVPQYTLFCCWHARTAWNGLHFLSMRSEWSRFKCTIFIWCAIRILKRFSLYAPALWRHTTSPLSGVLTGAGLPGCFLPVALKFKFKRDPYTWNFFTHDYFCYELLVGKSLNVIEIDLKKIVKEKVAT